MNRNKRIFALGFFDGVHLGHQALLSQCCRLAEELDVQAAAITFDRHPQTFFRKDPPGLINTAEDRQRLLRSYGIGPIYTLCVNRETMTTPWQDFLDGLIGYGAAGFVCGHDFRFGNRGEGNAVKLRAVCAEAGLPCVVVPEQKLDGITVSSTYIRSLLEAGDMERAVRFLGHPHILSGTVVQGKHLGRTLGIPTANLILPEGLVCPRQGVYACRAAAEGRQYLAVSNVGTCPTVGGHRLTVESWLLDFEGDLYGKQLELELHAFLRPECKFGSLTALREEILKNAGQTRELFEKM